MHVVATAGHVDHGKSRLVRALTGQDPDRLAEEKRRGLTIELGYCWTTLPGVGDVAFVDVPGHERFVTTMLAGVGPVPVAMLVVAADDPWMPQAAEHLAALDALDVTHGVLVVTRADLADPAPALARARAEVDTTSLHGIPAVVVSGHTGAGLDELRSTLAGVLSSVPAPDPAADVRLWVDRRFHVRGAGTVVTGTLPAGTVSVGDVLAGDGAEVRVRGLESLGTPRPSVAGVARVALDLGGRAPDAVGRGTALATLGAFEPSAVVDVRLSGPERLPAHPVLHVGSAHLGSRAHVLAPGVARLRLERPLPLRYGDRAVLRDPGSRRIWGVRVLDPAPPRRRRDIASHDGTPEAELRLRGVVRRSLLTRIGAPVEPLPAGAVVAGDWLVDAARAADLRRCLVSLVAAGPAAPAGAARALGLPDPVIVDALVVEPLRIEEGRIVGPGELPAALVAAAETLRGELSGFAAPEAGRLDELGLDAAALARLHRSGHLLRVDDRVVLLPGADERAVEVLATLPQPFTTSAARQALGTSRRVALPLLAHLDRSGRTVRLPDDRRRLR
ncbi:SelB C-terminal domain-containing protein [Nocardioides sp. YIM 152315]|uniref:SelB domain-containing protein n=1 Tax=Nocardioides sp. YIM 152315 TaxID=3031760 RepID=UPI0023DA6DE5|nr:SelB C-terminal domain-containing protein [Nocardioides sp. YIM 152315]MDF1606253.1 SelB C-terminal domain-containing protein [Nocardioides sp. YIM 152315]